MWSSASSFRRRPGVDSRNFNTDAQFVASFEKNRRAVLEAAANAIDAGKVTRDGRVYLSGEDFPSLR